MVSGSRARRRLLPLSRALHAEIGGRDDAQACGSRSESRRRTSATAIPSAASPARNSSQVAYDLRLVAAAAQQLEQHLAMPRRRRCEQRALALLGAEPAVDAVIGRRDPGSRADA